MRHSWMQLFHLSYRTTRSKFEASVLPTSLTKKIDTSTLTNLATQLFEWLLNLGERFFFFL